MPAYGLNVTEGQSINFNISDTQNVTEIVIYTRIGANFTSIPDKNGAFVVPASFLAGEKTIVVSLFVNTSTFPFLEQLDLFWTAAPPLPPAPPAPAVATTKAHVLVIAGGGVATAVAIAYAAHKPRNPPLPAKKAGSTVRKLKL
jgi:hypothetical protein